MQYRVEILYTEHLKVSLSPLAYIAIWWTYCVIAASLSTPVTLSKHKIKHLIFNAAPIYAVLRVSKWL